MSTNLKSYFRRLAEGYEDGALASFLRPGLEAASVLYGCASTASQWCYEKKILPKSRLPFPVISVGNLTWGGTGKTPFVEYLARKLGEQQKTVLILTRGYSHDEVEQFRHHVPNAILGVGKNRAQIAKRLSRQHKIDVAILDDGFQHWPLARDLEVVMVNALNPFGNGKRIPRGILRELPVALKRASIVVLSHANLIASRELEALREKIRVISPSALIIDSYLEPLFFYRAQKRTRVSLERLQNQRVSTFSAVGSPRSFQLLLSRIQIKPIRNFEFTDHHAFSAEELEEIKRVSLAGSADEIVTTEKDFYRSPEVITKTLNPLVLATRLRIAAQENELIGRLFQLSRGR